MSTRNLFSGGNKQGFIPIVDDSFGNDLNDISGIDNNVSMNIEETSIDIELLRRMNNNVSVSKERSPLDQRGISPNKARRQIFAARNDSSANQLNICKLPKPYIFTTTRNKLKLSFES